MKYKILVIKLLLLLITRTAWSQLVVDFSAANREACGSLQVSFANLCTFNGTPISCSNQYTYQWNFGATICQPSRIYNTPGTYQVCLTVRPNNGGAAVTTCKQNYITVWALPSVNYAANIREGCVPLTVNFTDQSTSTNGNIVSRLWDVGGSNPVSNGQTATTIYTLPASYGVRLIVTDDKGCTNFINTPNYIRANAVPVANFTANNTFSCSTPFSVNFTNTSVTTNPNTSYQWTFQGAGNFQSFNGATPPPVIWSQVGSYDVRLIIRDNATGCADTLLRPDFINVGNQVRFDVDRNVCVGEVVQFTDRSNGSPTAWLWNFGTGRPADVSTQQNPTFSYTSPGCYLITLTTTVAGCTNSFTSPICINVHAAPQPSISIDRPRGCAVPHAVNLSGSATGGNVSSWRWRINQNGTITQPTTNNTSFNFTQFGDHPIELTVTDQFGCQRTVHDTVRVREIDASIPTGRIMGCIPLTTTLSDNSSSVVPITNWEWVVDGVRYFGPNPSISFTNPADTGVYDVKLIVTNQLGCVDSVTVRNKIMVGLEPSIDFDATPREECLETSIAFTDLSSDYGDFWFWEFGDGGVSQEQNPVYQYQDTGYFTVCLTVFHNGCQKRECKERFIHIIEPRAGFEEVRNCEDPYTVAITANTIGADTVVYFFGTNEIVADTLMGSMGDSIVLDTIFVPFDSIPGIFNVSYTFQDTGQFVIVQWVKSFRTQCEHTASAEVYITDPKAIFYIDTLRGCVPFVVTPREESVFANQWQWSGPPEIEFSAPDTQSTNLIFQQAGKYVGIQLTITDINGCTDTYVSPDTITINEIYPGFTYFPSTGCTPLPVSFRDTSSNLYGNNISWIWDFGDGSPQASGQNVSHTYLEPDSLDISLDITDDFGCRDTLVLPQIITPTFPFASFEHDSVACTGQEVRFNNTTQGVGLKYWWDFGTGNPQDTSNLQSPTFAYAEERSYKVCMLAIDINGCADSVCHSVKVENPVAEFAFAPNYASCPPLIDTFTNLSINAIATGYIWDFGDGDSSNLVSPLHIYTEPGIYTVALTATGVSGCTHTIVKDSIIRIDGPRGRFTVEPLEGCRPHQVRVTTFSDLPAYHFVDYDDGMVDSSKIFVTEFTFLHTFNQTGKYLPRLTLEDAGGCRRSFTADSVFVEGIDIEIVPSDTLVCEGTQISFTNFSSTTRPITSFEWVFPGGVPATSTEWEPRVTYAQAGEYDVVFRVQNQLCRDSVILRNRIVVESYPTAIFAAIPNEGCEPLNVALSDSSRISSGTIGQWLWDFGDGTTGNGRTPPNHIYHYDENTSNGNYTIKLVVTSKNLICKDSVEHDVNVRPTPTLVPAPERTICLEESTFLNPQIVGAADGMVYRWTPAAGLSCTDCLTPFASPTATTNYQLIATNSSNCSDTASVRVNVIPHPIPRIDLIDQTVVCEQSVVVLQASVTNTPVLSFAWRDTTSSGRTLSCLDCANPFANPKHTTTYYLTVTGAGGCIANDSVTVEVIREFTSLNMPERGLCLGDTVHLQSPLGINPRWTPSTGLNCIFCESPVASPTQTTTYYLTTTYEGCPVTDSVRVRVFRQLDITAGEDKSVCLGESTTLNGAGFGVVSWSPTTFLDNPNAYITNVQQPSQTTDYTMTVTFDKCTLQDNVNVLVRTQAEVTAAADPTCLGEPAQLQATGVADAFVWSPTAGLSNPNIANPIANVSQNTTYTVTASLRNCASATAQVEVIVQTPPKLRYLEVHNFFLGQSVTMEVGVEGGSGDYSYQWTPAQGLSCSDCSNPSITPDTSLMYHVLVTDRATGCTAEGEVALRRGETCTGDLIQVPNAFTPNGDGDNDILYVRGTSLASVDVFRVFNRWGEVVFETSEISEGWDGKHRGAPVNPGVYVYYVEAPCALDGRKMFKKGNVTIIR